MEKKTLADRTEEYLKTHSQITVRDGFNIIGTTDLRGIIRDLRKGRGLNIITEYQNSTNRYGDKVKYATYKLVEKDEINNTGTVA